jgi:hypothetical protein
VTRGSGNRQSSRSRGRPQIALSKTASPELRPHVVMPRRAGTRTWRCWRRLRPVGCQNPGRPHRPALRTGTAGGRFGPTPCEDAVSSHGGRRCRYRGWPGPATIRECRDPGGSVTLGSGRDERAGHGLDRVCAPHKSNYCDQYPPMLVWRRVALVQSNDSANLSDRTRKQHQTNRQG